MGEHLVDRGGVKAGEVIYRYVEPSGGAYPTGKIKPGTVVGLVTDALPTLLSGCYSGSTHSHMDWKGSVGSSSNDGRLSTNDVRCPGVPQEEFGTDDIIAALIPIDPDDHPKYPEMPVA